MDDLVKLCQEGWASLKGKERRSQFARLYPESAVVLRLVAEGQMIPTDLYRPMILKAHAAARLAEFENAV